VAGGFRRQPDFDETMILAAPFTLGLECSSYACAIGVALAAHLYAAGAMAESNAAPAHMRLVQSALDKPSVIVLGTVVGATTRIALCQIEGTREVIRLKVGETYDGWTLRDVDNRQARFEKFEVLTVLLIHSPAPAPVAAKTASDPPPSPQPARRRKR